MSWPVAVLSLLLAGAAGSAGPTAHGDGAGTITRQGRVVCLDDRLAPLADEARCNEAGAARFALENAAGERLYFLADDPQAEMFIDPQVRAKELVVEGWTRPNRHLELLHVYSLEKGRLYHLHYRCDLCNITAKAPGPCWCCGQPFELREVPVEGEVPPVAPGAAGSDG